MKKIIVLFRILALICLICAVFDTISEINGDIDIDAISIIVFYIMGIFFGAVSIIIKRHDTREKSRNIGAASGNTAGLNEN